MATKNRDTHDHIMCVTVTPAPEERVIKRREHALASMNLLAKRAMRSNARLTLLEQKRRANDSYSWK